MDILKNNISQIEKFLKHHEEFSKGQKLKFIFVISKELIFKIINEWTPYDYTFKVVEEKRYFMKLEMTREVKRIVRRKIQGIVFLFKIIPTDLYVFFTFENQDFIEKVLLRYLENYNSEISKIHLNSNQIESFLIDLEKEYKAEINTEILVSYKRLFYSDFKKKKERESKIIYTNEPFRDSFLKAKKDSTWIDKINFSVENSENLLFKGYISREAIFKCNLSFNDFFNFILNRIIKIGEKKIKLFGNKSRLENKGAIKPIVFNFFAEVLRKESYPQLISVISKYPKSSYSIYHGNPYLHMGIVDYNDGSSYDLWITEPNKLIIIPQLKATLNSLTRFSEFISTNFTDGEITEKVL